MAEMYGRLEGPIPWPRMRWLAKLPSEVGAGSAILDLGCGSGDPVGVHLSKEHKVAGVDISWAQIDLARVKAPTGHFIHGDAVSVDFPIQQFFLCLPIATISAWSFGFFVARVRFSGEHNMELSGRAATTASGTRGRVFQPYQLTLPRSAPAA